MLFAALKRSKRNLTSVTRQFGKIALLVADEAVVAGSAPPRSILAAMEDAESSIEALADNVATLAAH